MKVFTKSVLCFLVFLFLTSFCFSQGVRKDDIAISSVGGFLTGVPNAQVRVCVDGALGLPCNPTVPIYSNSDLAPGHALPNPFTADGQGNYFFYTFPGTYEVQVTTPTGTYTQNDQTYPNLPSVVTTTFNYTLVASSSTPVFSFVPNMMYRMVLTSNVASSTLVGVPAPGNVAAFSLCQDGVGGRTFSFPSNFVLPSGFTVNPFAGVCTNFIFLYDGTNWQGIGGWSQVFSLTLPVPASQGGTGVSSPATHGVAIGEGSSIPFNFAVPTNNAQCFMSSPTNFLNIDPSFQTCPGGGGGGGSSAGPQGTLNAAGLLAGTFQATGLSESGGVLTNSDNNSNRGPNLGVDITYFGARPVNGASVPATTGTITGGTNALVVANGTGFQKNDSIALVNGGATNCGTPPAAPTVIPSLAASMTGTGFSVPGATGSTSMSYAVIAHSQGGCYTAASPVTTISNASNALGANTLPITSQSISLFTVTVTVGSTANLATGTWGRFGGTTDDQEFGGDNAITIVDGTHFTYQTNINSLYTMFSNSASGGTFYYWPENHIVLPALPAGTNMLNETVYRCINTPTNCALPANAANYSLVYISYPLTGFNNSAADSTYGTWDDYGTTMTPALVLNQSAPWYIPATPPATNVNDMLVTTVTNIVGPAFTLATNATNTVGASSCNGGACSLRFDDAPAIAAAIAASNTFTAGGGGAVHIPPIVEDGTGQLCYQTSSYLTVSGIVNQGGPLCAGDTVELANGSSWNGTFEDGIRTSGGSNSTQKLITFLSHGANPTLWRKNSTIRNITLATSGPGSLGVFDISGNATVTENVNFTTDTAANDYMGILYYFLNDDSGTGLFGGTFNNTAWISGPNQVVGSTNTPLFISKNGGEWHFHYFSGHTRGFYFSTNNSNPAAAFFITLKMGEEIQGPITPLFTFNSCCTGNRGGMIYLEHFIGDSGSEAMVSNASVGGSMGAPIFLNGINGGQSFAPIITGKPFNGGVSIITDQPIVNRNLGMNHDITECNGVANVSDVSYIACRLPSLNLATTSYSGNHTLNASEGIVNVTATATITAPHALAGQTWQVNCQSGICTLAIDSGTLFGNQTTGSIIIPPSQGVNVACNGVNCFAAGLTKPYAGAGAGIVTGPTISANNDLVIYTGLGGQTADSGISLPNVALRNTGNVFSIGVQDFSAVSEFRPKAGTVASIPVACNIPDIYFGTDATPGQNWFFCTVSGNPGTWTQQLNSGFLGLNTYSGPHTLNINETWANFNATTTVTVPHVINTRRWVVFCVSPCSTLTLAPDSGNITLNNLTASTAAITTGLGVEVACDGTNCFAWGLGGSGGGSGTVSSCTVNGVAYYSAVTTTFCVTPPTGPNGVPQTIISTPSGGVSQPPASSLPGIVGRAVSGIAATDTILSTDCNPNRVEYVGSVAVAVTLPTAVTLGVPKCVFKLVNTTVPPQAVTITPTTWTINGNSTLALMFGQQLWVYVDPNSSTNWVADQTDLFGNVSGGAVPASAKLIGTNSSSQLIAAALANTHIYVGSAGNLPIDVAVSGDATIANTGVLTVIGANGGTFPASASVLGTDSSKRPVIATGHNLAVPLECADTSGSGSAQVCNTSPTFTPIAGDSVMYTTTTANTGAALSVNVNSLGAKSVAKWQTATTLAANDVRANTDVFLTYDGTNWELATVGNVPSGGGGGTPCITTNLSLQFDSTGAFGCVTEFTYASSTITMSSTGKLDLSAGSVTAALKLPTAAAASPTNGGILSYDSTNNRMVLGNATNTSIIPWFTAAPTTNVLRKASGTLGLQIDSSITDNGTLVSTTEGISVAPTSTSQVGAIVNNPTSTSVDIADFQVNGVNKVAIGSAGTLTLGTATCTVLGTAGGLCAAEGTEPTNVAGAATITPDSTTHEIMVATNGASTSTPGMLVRRQPSPIHQTGQTGAIATATLCAASAGACNVAGQYHIHFTFIETGTACGTPGTGGVTFLLTWTDSNGTTHSAISVGFDDASAINAVSQTFHFQTTLAAAWASGDFNISTNGTVIQYATGYTACGVGTGTYQLDAAVTRLQ